MPGSTPPTRHRRDSGSSGRAKIAATAIAVTTLLLSIAAAVDSHRIVEAWRGHIGANLGAPVGADDPGPARARIVATTPHVARPGRVHPDPARATTPTRPAGAPTGPPTGSPAGSPGWVWSMSPACDQQAPPGTSAPAPTSPPSPVSAPNPPSTSAPTAVSTPDSAPTCPPPPSSGPPPSPTTARPLTDLVLINQ